MIRATRVSMSCSGAPTGGCARGLGGSARGALTRRRRSSPCDVLGVERRVAARVRFLGGAPPATTARCDGHPSCESPRGRRRDDASIRDGGCHFVCRVSRKNAPTFHAFRSIGPGRPARRARAAGGARRRRARRGAPAPALAPTAGPPAPTAAAAAPPRAAHRTDARRRRHTSSGNIERSFAAGASEDRTSGEGVCLFEDSGVVGGDPTDGARWFVEARRLAERATRPRVPASVESHRWSFADGGEVGADRARTGTRRTSSASPQFASGSRALLRHPEREGASSASRSVRSSSRALSCACRATELRAASGTAAASRANASCTSLDAAPSVRDDYERDARLSVRDAARPALRCVDAVLDERRPAAPRPTQPGIGRAGMQQRWIRARP